jgi:hypothetical protein
MAVRSWRSSFWVLIDLTSATQTVCPRAQARSYRGSSARAERGAHPCDAMIRASSFCVLLCSSYEGSRTLAYEVVASQFEHIIAAPYVEAIGSLPSGQRTALYTLASLGSPTYGAWNDVLLLDLAGSGDRTALPALQRWATRLDSNNPVVQEVVTCYVLAIQGCAQFMTEPPELADSQDGDRAAWGCYGAIIFWMNKPGLTTAESRDKALPYWEQLNSALRPAAADPLIRLRTATLAHPGKRTPVIQQVLTAFPDEIRPILEWSLQHHTVLTSIFTGFHEDHLNHIVKMLAVVGNAATADLLHAYIDHLQLGNSVIATIKALTGNHAG